MRKTGYIISFILVFIIMLSAAVMPFAADGIKTEGVSETEKILSESGKENIIPEIAASDDIFNNDTEETKKILPESTKENNFSEEETSVKKEINNDIIESTEKNTETDTENKSVIIPEPPMADGNNNENIIPLTTKNASLYEYKPGAPEEIIKELYILDANKGILTEKKSVHAYEFSLKKRSVMRYTLNHEEIKGTDGWNAALYQEYFINGADGETGWRLINVLTTQAGKTSHKSPKIGLNKGNYRLVITPKDKIPYVQYRLAVSFDETTAYETECNDNIYRYNEIYSNMPLSGSASALPGTQDADYYMFRMFSDGYANISFEHSEEDGLAVLWQISILTEDGRELYGVNSSAGDRILYSGNIGLEAGNYFISVKNRVYTDKSYILTFSRGSNVMFEKEFNDSFADAQKIHINSYVSGSLSARLRGIDRDYFEFNVPEKGYMTLEFWHVSIPVNNHDQDKPGWNVKVYSADKSVYSSMRSNWDSDVTATQAIGLSPGKYYISVDGDDLYHSHEQYSVYVNFSKTDSWETEPNNSFETADNLKRNKAVFGSLAENGTEYDNDYYTFTTSGTGDVSIVFSHDKLKYSKDIFTFTLYDKNKHKVGYINSAGEPVFEIKVKSDEAETEMKYKSLPAGKYYIKVSTGLFFDSIQYSVSYKCE